MFSIQVLVVLPLLYSFACAQVVPRASTFHVPSWHNSTIVRSTTIAPSTILTPSTTPTGLPQKCCFLIQDTLSEVWWEQTRYRTDTVTVTTFSYWETVLPNTTIINTNSSVHTSTEVSSRLVGLNPITLVDNSALPYQTAATLTGTMSRVTTGGVVVESPAAFYVFSTVRIITADAVADFDGNFKCGTNVATMGQSFTSLNSNAQAYFGTPSIETIDPIDYSYQEVTTADLVERSLFTTATPLSPVATPTSPTAGFTSVAPVSNDAFAPTPTVLTLLQPFIYTPSFASRGKVVADEDCRLGEDVEDFGYLPQAVRQHLLADNHYAAQYPGLEDCLPAGPSIDYSVRMCPLMVGSTATAIGGDLTESVYFRVNQQGMSLPIKTKGPEEIPKPKEPEKPKEEEKPQPKEPEKPKEEEKPKSEDTKPVVIVPDAGSQNNAAQSQEQSAPTDTPKQENSGNGGSSSNNQQSQPKPADKPQEDSIGAIINSIMGGDTKPNARTGEQSPAGSNSETNNNKPIVYTAGAIVPVEGAPSGITGDIKTVNGQPVYFVSNAITAPENAASRVGYPTSSQMIDGTLFFIVPSATNLPLANAPAGIKGSTIVSDGKSYLAIPGPITYAQPAVNTQVNNIGATKIADGSTFLVIPSATNIPLAAVPAGLKGSTIVSDGKTYLSVPGPVTYAAPQNAANAVPNIGTTKVVDGSTFLIIPSQTNIPLAKVPAGLKGSTTIIDGKSYLAIQPTTYAPASAQITSDPKLGTTLLIGDVPFVVLPSGRELALSDALALGISTGGITKTVNGKTIVSFSAATTVAAINTADPSRGYGSTTLVDGTPFLILPTGKPIPLSLFPSGLGADAKTTRINNEDFLIIPSSTRVQLPLKPSSTKDITGGMLTVIIDGSSRLIIAGPTTMPINSYFDVEGSKTVISGTTMVVVTGATTVPVRSTSEESRTPTAVLPVPTAGSQAPDSGAVGRAVGSGVGWVVGAFGVVLML